MEPDNIKYSYETLWKFIIRPPRDEYTEEDLGENHFIYHRKTYTRSDYSIISSEGYALKCSFIQPDPECRPREEMPVVIYLHGNSSSRLEGLRMAHILLKNDINLFIFDFAGSGISEGEYISLGYHEKDDIKTVIDFLERIPGVGKIGLWGRSMGAATTMLYAHHDNRIKVICMDSPFADFSKLAKELCLKHVSKIPNFLIDVAMSIVRSTIKKKNGLDIYKLKPINCAEKTTIPAIFIHALNDELINIEHTIELCEKYGGEKSIYSCKGGHNSPRPRDIVDKIGTFFAKHLNNGNNDDYFLKDENLKESYYDNDKDIGHSQNFDVLNNVINNINLEDLKNLKESYNVDDKDIGHSHSLDLSTNDNSKIILEDSGKEKEKIKENNDKK